MSGVKFFVLFCAAVFLVTAAQGAPMLPSEYYGSVSVNGAPAQPGTIIKAVIGGTERGSITVATAGTYGGTGTFDSRLSVALTEEELKATGAPAIEFLVNDQKASQTAQFQAGTSTRLDLSFGSPASGTDKQGENQPVSATKPGLQGSAGTSQSSQGDSGDFPTVPTTQQAPTAGTTVTAAAHGNGSGTASPASSGTAGNLTAPVSNGTSTGITTGNGSVVSRTATAASPVRTTAAPVPTTKKSPVGYAALVSALAGCVLLAARMNGTKKN